MTGLINEDPDAVDDALQAELERAGWIVGGAVLGACGSAGAYRCRVAGWVEDFGQQRAVGLPPLLVRDACAGLGFGGFDGSSRGAADVVI